MTNGDGYHDNTFDINYLNIDFLNFNSSKFNTMSNKHF